MRPRVTAVHRLAPLADAGVSDGVLLAGDIGGTKVALGLYSQRQGVGAPLVESEFPSADYPSLGPVVREFLGDKKVRIDRACFAAAGPVIGGSRVRPRARRAGERLPADPQPAHLCRGDVALERKYTQMADATARIVIQNALFWGRKKLSSLTIPWCT